MGRVIDEVSSRVKIVRLSVPGQGPLLIEVSRGEE